MIRGIIKTVAEGLIKRFSATGRADETIDNREYFQHYGFTSRPLGGAEAIIIKEGNHIIMIASDDRRYRLRIEEGEAALYDDLEQKVYLTRNGIVASSPIKITAEAPEVDIIASTKVMMITPLLEVTGNIVSGADITAAGNISDMGGTKSMSGMREVYDEHKHGDSDVPDREM